MNPKKLALIREQRESEWRILRERQRMQETAFLEKQQHQAIS
ncbi:MAG: hypothetical protein ACP5OA_06795 [Candidatus Woesearchaeota archaeon]